MTDPTIEGDRQNPGGNRTGNFGVPTGAILVLICFFLPWLQYSGLSAFQIAICDTGTADSILNLFGLASLNSVRVMRMLFFIPILTLMILIKDLSFRPESENRIVNSLGLLASSAALTFFMVFLGVHLGWALAYGFWGALTGALFISVGVVFNVIRGE